MPDSSKKKTTVLSRAYANIEEGGRVDVKTPGLRMTISVYEDEAMRDIWACAIQPQNRQWVIFVPADGTKPQVHEMGDLEWPGLPQDLSGVL